LGLAKTKVLDEVREAERAKIAANWGLTLPRRTPSSGGVVTVCKDCGREDEHPATCPTAFIMRAADIMTPRELRKLCIETLRELADQEPSDR
jgi:hypothetical protein